jgi:hypothetical protein
MKIIQNENYITFVKRNSKHLTSQSVNMIYVGLVLLGIGIYWFEDGFEAMIKVLLSLIAAFFISSFLLEIVLTFISKEISFNNFITQVCSIIILTALSFVFYDDNFRYWTFVLGLILFVPQIVLLTFEKIRSWF